MTGERTEIIPARWVGMTVGFFLGYIAVRFGGWSLLLVTITGLLGYWISAYREGAFSLTDLAARLDSRRREF